MAKIKTKNKGEIGARNKRAKFDYDILETYEAGIVLSGAEVKAVKEGQARLQGAYVSIHGSRPILRGAFIARYKPAGPSADYDPTRDRDLLLHKAEVRRLIGKMHEAGLTLIPTRLYSAHRLVKVEIALARGKKQFEKRAAIKKRELDREIRTRMYERQK